MITFANETLVMNKSKLLILDRKILREMCGPAQNSDLNWRIKTASLPN